MHRDDRRSNPPWLIGLRYLSLVVLFAPLLGTMIVWGSVAVASLSGDRDAVFKIGNEILIGLLALGALGLLIDFLILPVLLSDKYRRGQD